LNRTTDPPAPTGTAAAAGGTAFTAEARDLRRRLDVVVADHLPELSRARAARLAAGGWIFVDETPRRAAFRLRPGQTVRVVLPPPEPSGIHAEPIPLDVVYEDRDLLVINKPPGLTVHPAPGHRGGTLVNAVLARVPNLPGIAGSLRPGIVHRLDKDTSGLLVVAKSDEAHRGLAAQLRDRTMSRTYLAVVRGNVPRPEGTISAPLGRHPVHRTRIAVVPGGRGAVTHYTRLEQFPDAALLACRLETGRTHQIRVHLAHIGHPVLGDPLYGRARVPELRRQALHAARLEFTHPRSGRRIVCTAPVPPDIHGLLERLRGHT
jgi:23S rRNA pseudouridine1911/1915/1917 synthase